MDKKEDKIHINIDFPVFLGDSPHSRSQRVTMNSLRIISLDLGRYSGDKQWQESLASKYRFIPKLEVYSKDFRARLNGDVLSGYNDQREIEYLESSLEISVWMILAGINGYGERDNFAGILREDDMNISYKRESYGGSGFAGFKYGSFHDNFFAVKFGKGALETRVEETYRSNIVELPAILWYLGKIKTNSISAEGQLLWRNVLPYLLLESNKYEFNTEIPGIIHSLDVDAFRQTTLSGGAEVVPMSRFGFARVMIKFRKDFGKREGLLFKSDPPKFQVLLRLKF